MVLQQFKKNLNPYQTSEAVEQQDTETCQQSKDPWQNKATGKKQFCKRNS